MRSVIASKNAVAILKHADYHMLMIYLIYEFMIYLISSRKQSTRLYYSLSTLLCWTLPYLESVKLSQQGWPLNKQGLMDLEGL